jgi:hypothetical protein
VGTRGEYEQGYAVHIICLSWKGRILVDFLESKDIRLHDGENERGGGGEDKWWPETLYRKPPADIKTEEAIPFYDLTKADLRKP